MADTSLASSKENKKVSVSRDEGKRKGAVGRVVRKVGKSLRLFDLELSYPHIQSMSINSCMRQGEELLGASMEAFKGRRSLPFSFLNGCSSNSSEGEV